MSYAEALERLKKTQNGPDRELTEPTKAPYVSFVSATPGTFGNFKASGREVSCQQKALSKTPLLNADLSKRATRSTDRTDRTMPSRPELERICRRVTAEYPRIGPERLRRFLEVAEDPAWCSERVARHIARRMSEGLIWELTSWTTIRPSPAIR